MELVLKENIKETGLSEADIANLFAEKRFASGTELALCADDTYPFQVTKDEFKSLPASEKELEVRGEIYNLAALAKLGPYVDERITNIEGNCTLIHRFSPGIYVREFRMPQNSIVVSRRHSREHIVMVLSGTSTVKTEHGEEIITAPAIFISHAGAKRLLINHTDTVWATVHRTDACSIAAAELELLLDETEENTEAMLGVLTKHKLLGDR